jgi:hypothetical protein
MSGHTPGPWQLSLHVSNCVYWKANDEYNSLYVIADDVGGRRHGENYEDLSEVEANARLISAAPEMYEALKDLVYQVQGPDQPAWLCLKDARAAIDKAEGK